MAGYFHWSYLLLTASLDDWAVLAVIDSDDVVVQALMLNTLWVCLVLPAAARLVEVTMVIGARTAILSSDASCSVESGSVSTVAAVVSLDAAGYLADRVTDVGPAECCWVAVGLGVFKHMISAFLDLRSFLWSVRANFWMFINAIWAILVSIAVDLVIERAEGHARRAAGVIQFHLHLVLAGVTRHGRAARHLAHRRAWRHAATRHAVRLCPRVVHSVTDGVEAASLTASVGSWM